MTNTISIASIVSSKDRKPYVQIQWSELKAQLSPTEARQHAYNILECANAAEMDAILVRFLSDKVGLDDVNVATILSEFRSYREEL